MANITLRGTPFHTNGELPNTGELAPAFTLVNKDLQDLSLGDYTGKKKLLSIVPSLDTPTCSLSTKKINQAAIEYPDTIFLIISADLPFAMSRFCAQENLENIISLSIMRSQQFSRDYGVLIEDGPLAGITARAIVVIDESDLVLYTELVCEISEEPNYDAALAVL